MDFEAIRKAIYEASLKATEVTEDAYKKAEWFPRNREEDV